MNFRLYIVQDTKIERPTSGSGRGQKSDIINTVRKMKWSWAGHISLKDDRWPLGDHMTRKDDKGDQPSGGETT